MVVVAQREEAMLSARVCVCLFSVCEDRKNIDLGWVYLCLLGFVKMGGFLFNKSDKMMAIFLSYEKLDRDGTRYDIGW